MSIKTWSDEDEAELIKLYTTEGVKDVYELASMFNKGHRSVISKLVQLKIYEKPMVDESGKAQSVKVMLREIENMLEIRIEGHNLNKKDNLILLVEALRKKVKK